MKSPNKLRSAFSAIGNARFCSFQASYFAFFHFHKAQIFAFSVISKTHANISTIILASLLEQISDRKDHALVEFLELSLQLECVQLFSS